MLTETQPSDSFETLLINDFTVITEPAYPAGWRSSPHAHKQLEINLVREGAGYILLADEEWFIEAGDVFFVPSAVAHGFSSETGVSLMVIQFHYLTFRLLEQLINTPPIGCFSLSILDKSRFTDLALRLQQEIAGDLPLASVQCQTLIEQLVIIMLRTRERKQNSRLTPEQQRLIEPALVWMQSNSHENIRIGDVAARAGLSTVYFRQLFRSAMGVSPKQYLSALRLQASKCMLMHNRAISDVASCSGFGSSQEFSKAFHRLTGLTPSAWKKANLVDHNVAYSKNPIFTK